MAGIALEGSKTQDTTVSAHVQYRRYELVGYTPIDYDEEGNPIGGGEPIYVWNYYYTNATVKGICNASSSNVFVNGKKVVLQWDTVSEYDEYSIPSGAEYVGGAHNDATGTVTGGNNKNVYINGKRVAVVGNIVATHAGVPTPIQEGSNNVFIG